MTDDRARFYFGDIVVDRDGLIGCVVKSWEGTENRERHYEVYVRSLNHIEEHNESELQRYVVSMELSEEEMELSEEERTWH